MQMNVTFKALDRVNYENLGCGSKQLCEKLHAIPKSTREPKKKIFNPTSLQDIAASKIVHHDVVVRQSLECAPVHLMSLLLGAAFKEKQIEAISLLISEWPLDVLELRHICPDQKQTLFASAMEFDRAIVMGLMRREESLNKCRLKVLDLRGFHINEVFAQVLVGAVPLLSILEKDRSHEKLTELLLAFLTVEGARGEVKLGSEQLTNLEMELKPVIDTLLKQVNHGSIYVPKGEKFVIKLDKIEFGQENKLKEFLVMSALRNVSPCQLDIYNLCVNANFKETEKLSESCALVLSLFGLDPQILQGLSLNNVEDETFQCVLNGVTRFSGLKALDLGSCNICVTGRTRVRSLLRARITNLFSTFQGLIRLDLRKSELTGNVGVLLDTLKTPLEYINLSGCHLGVEDLTYLGNCRHTTSLSELHLSSLVRKGEIKGSQGLLDCVSKMNENLVVLEIQNNEIGNDQIDTLCSLVPKFRKLKMLDTLYNFMSQESLLKLVKACANCPPLHCLALNLLPIFGSEQAVLERRLAFQQDCEQVLLQCKRQDMTLLVVAIGIE